MKGSLKDLETRFEARSASIGKDAATQELFDMRWGPTRVPVYNVILTLKYMAAASGSSSSSSFLRITNFLIKTALVSVDGTDMSGTTALMHAIGTKPYMDTEFAQVMLDAFANINRRNRYGETVAHEIAKVHPHTEKAKSIEAFKWFVAHGGDVDIKDSEGITPRFMVTNTAVARIAPQMLKALPPHPAPGRRCTACNSNETYLDKALSACAACKAAFYCSKDCQKIDWRQVHRKQCKKAT